ncbi:MAG: helix-turn-helix domain-containing protein [Actinomycetota bacterium]|nr:helix-turn-helix domain-containing protein [Actinomycetota bacterium]
MLPPGTTPVAAVHPGVPHPPYSGSSAEAEPFASVATLISEPTRARVLCALLAVDGQLCVGDIALALEVPFDAVSYALRPLGTAGFVQRRREGRAQLLPPRR